MSEKSNQNTVASTADAGNSAVKAMGRKYKIEKLRENSIKLFDITTSTFDGALHGLEKTEMTIDEARGIINKWLGRKE